MQEFQNQTEKRVLVSVQAMCDEYAYCIPNPKHTPKYTKAKVPCTQDKHTQLSSFAKLCCYPKKALLLLAYQSMLTHTTNWLPVSLRTRYVRSDSQELSAARPNKAAES